MRKIQVALVSVVLVVVFASVSAFAADGTCPAKGGTCPAAGAKDAKGCCAATGAAASPAEMSGKVEAKTEKAADGKEMKSYYLSVSDAKCAAGKECPQMKGKTVKLTGAKAAEAEKLAGKQVDVKGTCGSSCAEFDVASVTEKK
ncbi:MAG: hypothetical protein NTU83_11150 [Candidatus Hydrogenedentes bacterium]|nr:hypothetical protein [Candidatus Hydrogenedentota bacterium]